jgi:trimethylamine--corrinoid protein Co-methyltransferase
MRLNKPEVLSQTELKTIHETSLNILAEVGILVDSDNVRRLLADAGARVEAKTGLVKIPHQLTQRALETAPQQVTLLSRDGRAAITPGDGHSYAACGHAAINFDDIPARVRRPATKADVSNLFRLADALELFSFVAPPAIPMDVPPATCYAHAADAAFNNSTKHLYLPPETAEATELILEMARVVADTGDLNQKPVISCQVSIQSPLGWPTHLCDNVMAVLRSGVPIAFHCAPLVGLSAPVTLAGLLALQNAEVLSGFVVTQAFRAGYPTIYGGGWGTFDLRTTTRVLGSPEGALLRLAGGQLGRFYRLPNHTLGPDTDAHCLDEQLGWEKMLSAYAALSAGIGMVVNASMYGTGMTVSLEQLMIDHEILELTYRLLEGISVTPDTIAYEVIKAVCPQGNFMMEEHTLKHLRSGEHWLPHLANRYGYDQWRIGGAPDVVRRATERVRQILAVHRPEPLDEAVQKELQRIISAVERAKP